MATLQARRLLPTNRGRPDTDSAFLNIYIYPATSCWLFEQCSKFNPHQYLHSVRPGFGDRDITASISSNYLYSDNNPMVTSSPLTVPPQRIPSIPTPRKSQRELPITPVLTLLASTPLIPLLPETIDLPGSPTPVPPRSTPIIGSRNTHKSGIEAINNHNLLTFLTPPKEGSDLTEKGFGLAPICPMK